MTIGAPSRIYVTDYVCEAFGRNDEVPELSSTVQYDGYKADILASGNLFYKDYGLVC